MVQSLHKFSLSWVIFLAKCLVVILWAWFGDLGRLLDFAKACFGRLDLFWFVWIFFGLVGFISVWYACLDVSGLLFVCWAFFWVSASVGWIAVALLGLFPFFGGCPCLLCLLLLCWAIQVMLSFVALPGFVALSGFLS